MFLQSSVFIVLGETLVCSFSNRIHFLFYNGAGVGRAGTFCIVYSAIRELHGTRNIGKERLTLFNTLEAVIHTKTLFK